MRCKLCDRFYCALHYSWHKDKKLRTIWKKFKMDDRSRRAFIFRSHAVGHRDVHYWIMKELYAMSSQLKSLKRKTPPDASQTTPKPVFQHNDTRADMDPDPDVALYISMMKPVATDKEEHPHCHLGRHRPSMSPCITGGVTSPPM